MNATEAIKFMETTGKCVKLVADRHPDYFYKLFGDETISLLLQEGSCCATLVTNFTPGDFMRNFMRKWKGFCTETFEPYMDTTHKNMTEETKSQLITEETRQQLWDQGWAAYWEGKEQSYCPSDPVQEIRDAWMTGWLTAQSADSEIMSIPSSEEIIEKNGTNRL